MGFNQSILPRQMTQAKAYTLRTPTGIWFGKRFSEMQEEFLPSMVIGVQLSEMGGKNAPMQIFIYLYLYVYNIYKCAELNKY